MHCLGQFFPDFFVTCNVSPSSMIDGGLAGGNAHVSNSQYSFDFWAGACWGFSIAWDDLLAYGLIAAIRAL
jgi:hypothetical protein